ncbi:Hypothetical predicted protein [Mytilus galloprovincialis]|uniref:Uncharacterized protein n=1 Tax=Mytilus galloprovincialis TaxID=29158 RepID=A0A8B6FJN8_MYTGA|nr:Hypothetical predicted protein [Mytilus galloprovincialis]
MESMVEVTEHSTLIAITILPEKLGKIQKGIAYSIKIQRQNQSTKKDHSKYFVVDHVHQLTELRSHFTSCSRSPSRRSKTNSSYSKLTRKRVNSSSNRSKTNSSSSEPTAKHLNFRSQRSLENVYGLLPRKSNVQFANDDVEISENIIDDEQARVENRNCHMNVTIVVAEIHVNSSGTQEDSRKWKFDKNEQIFDDGDDINLILERDLSDCLPGGILNENTDGIDINLREQSKSVATTNIISERDFANLDRLQREKPYANLIALEELISNLKVLIHLNINVNNAQSGTQDACIIFCIKSKEEKEQIMEKQRELICKKLNEIKLKQNHSVCEPVQKKPRKSNSNNANHQNQNHDNVEETDFVVSKPSDTYTPKSIALKAGQYIAVAYIDTWYPGQILFVKNDLLVQVKFLCPSQNMGNLFKWPQKDDISVVEKIFIFCSDFEVNAKDSGGRTWFLTNYDTICSEYKKYFNTYFV